MARRKIFKPHIPPTTMIQRRIAHKLSDGLYMVISRDGRKEYTLQINSDGIPVHRDELCEASNHGIPCYHQVVCLRHYRNELREKKIAV